MNYATVCSGIEAPTVAWHGLGWNPVFFSQFDPEHDYNTGLDFPSKLLQHRYPHVPNLGDMNLINGNDYAGTIDILCGGTPCQSFSVAGLRAGLADPRGNLTLIFLRLVDRIRPKWFLWENVPGVLSSNKGRDFGSLIGALAKLGYGFTYRVLDAQFFGVPQRRRRVFLVGHHSGRWEYPAAVLFEPESVYRYFGKGGKTGEDVTGTLAARTRGGGGLGTDFECDGGLIMSTGQANAELVIDGSPALTCNHESPIYFDMSQITSPQNRSTTEPGNPAWTMLADSQPAIFQTRFARNGRGAPDNIASALTYQSGRTGKGDSQQCVFTNRAVRRITPIECERLQGFPDNYTLIHPRTSDSKRYKALGNSMAVPVIEWIGQRIAKVQKIAEFNGF